MRSRGCHVIIRPAPARASWPDEQQLGAQPWLRSDFQIATRQLRQLTEERDAAAMSGSGLKTAAPIANAQEEWTARKVETDSAGARPRVTADISEALAARQPNELEVAWGKPDHLADHFNLDSHSEGLSFTPQREHDIGRQSRPPIAARDVTRQLPQFAEDLREDVQRLIHTLHLTGWRNSGVGLEHAHSNTNSRGGVVNTNCEVECADSVIHLNPANHVQLTVNDLAADSLSPGSAIPQEKLRFETAWPVMPPMCGLRPPHGCGARNRLG